MRAETAGGLTLRPLLAADWPGVERIYEAGIANRQRNVRDRGSLVGAHGTPPTSAVTGWWRSRQGRSPAGRRSRPSRHASATRAWPRTASTSRAGAQGLGVGTALLTRLVADAELAGIWTIQAGIFPENEASLALHRRCGFRIVGVRASIGRLDGRWRDVVLLERRSEVIR